MKKAILLIVCVMAITVFVGGCSTYPSNQNQSLYDASAEKTQVSPNWSYIDFDDLYGGVEDNTAAIGNAILVWEQNNPSQRIVNMQIIYSQAASGSMAVVKGISIYSESR